MSEGKRAEGGQSSGPLCGDERDWRGDGRRAGAGHHQALSAAVSSWPGRPGRLCPGCRCGRSGRHRERWRQYLELAHHHVVPMNEIDGLVFIGTHGQLAGS